MDEHSIPTNNAFRALLAVLRLYSEKDYVIELFQSQGWDIGKSKLKAWSTPAGEYREAFRPMPREALEAFIEALKEAKLVNNNGA